jgi:hypothetical protein
MDHLARLRIDQGAELSLIAQPGERPHLRDRLNVGPARLFGFGPDEQRSYAPCRAGSFRVLLSATAASITQRFARPSA